MARKRSVVARLVVAGLLATVVALAIPVVMYGPPTWVPQALVPSFLERTGPTVALVPGPASRPGSGSGAEASAFEVLAEPALGASEGPAPTPSADVVLLARTVDGDEWARVAYGQMSESPPVVVDESIEAATGITHLSVGTFPAASGVDEPARHRWLQVATDRGHLVLWSGLDTSEAELVELAAMVDPAMFDPAGLAAGLLSGLELASGWRVVTSASDSLAGAMVRRIGHELVEPEGYVEVTTRTDVGAEAWRLVGNPTVADRLEVRGRPALITGLESNTAVTLSWMEEPGLAVELTVVAPSDDLLSHALRLAEDLRPVDQAGWDSLAAEAQQSSREEPPDPDEVPDPPTVILAGPLADGRQFRIEERSGAALCVVVDGVHPLDRCDQRPGRGRDGSVAALPRLVDPGDMVVEDRQPLLVYGYLPERRLRGDWGRVQDSLGDAVPVGQAVSVHVEDTRGRSYGLAPIVGGAWAMHISEVTLGLIVTYTFPDGTTLEVEPDPGEEPDGDTGPTTESPAPAFPPDAG